jgi:HAD superfamily hydrolase (TIGR01509 family)
MPAGLWSGLIFDHDGTLVDSVGPDFVACSALCAELGVELHGDEWAREICGRIDAYDRLFDHLLQVQPRLDRDALWRRLRELWTIHLTEETIRLLPGARELAASLHGSGVPLAVASSSDGWWTRRWLRHFTLERYFAAVVAREDVSRVKPEPDVYFEAARRLGVAPAECLVFEDSLTGINAAKAAGMTVVAIPTEHTRGLDHSCADAVVTHLTEVSSGLLRALYVRSQGCRV